MASSYVLRMWLNAQQILLCQWAGNARQISRHQTIPYAHFPFPFFQRFATLGCRRCSRPKIDAMSCHSSSEATGASEMPQFAVSPSLTCHLPTKGFWCFLKPFSSLCRGLHAGKAIRHTCIVFFQTYGALGLPMCHVFTVSGSSLPVPIFIERWIDHINLQAEVTKSGMK